MFSCPLIEAVTLLSNFNPALSTVSVVDFDDRKIHYFVNDRHHYTYTMPTDIEYLRAAITWQPGDLEIHLFDKKANFVVPTQS